MRLTELKNLVDERLASGDWGDMDVRVFDSDGNAIDSAFEIGFEIDSFTDIDALIFTEL